MRILFLLVFLFFSCKKNNTISNGDLDNTFSSSVADVDPIVSFREQEENKSENQQSLESELEELKSQGWNEEALSNGVMPSCYNFKSKRSKIDNSLEITVGRGTDVVVKLMSLKNDKCIRYVYINSGTTYSINNIPEGKYYLKIAYGKNWISKVEDGRCVGKFLTNPLYEKGDDILDYNIQYTATGYSVPSYNLQLDVISTNMYNSFNSSNISEESFNQ
ncbi:hypothetical protein [Ornithobacterium rhinotracheale]|uniref:hypothetical protein n=1 Tax=Ornithobacterium rhinotracheale TaxID=28251 RepID=UPI003FD656E2